MHPQKKAGYIQMLDRVLGSIVVVQKRKIFFDGTLRYIDGLDRGCGWEVARASSSGKTYAAAFTAEQISSVGANALGNVVIRVRKMEITAD